MIDTGKKAAAGLLTPVCISCDDSDEGDLVAQDSRIYFSVALPAVVELPSTDIHPSAELSKRDWPCLLAEKTPARSLNP
jgi:hypothetical protein